MQIVYSACGDSVKPEFLVSLKSLYLFAVSSLTRGPAYYHIHVLSDGAVTHADLAFLKPRSNFRASLHSTYPGATTLFKKCSTERIYLHQHQDFQNIDKVRTAHHASLLCSNRCKPRVIACRSQVCLFKPAEPYQWAFQYGVLSLLAVFQRALDRSSTDSCICHMQSLSEHRDDRLEWSRAEFS